MGNHENVTDRRGTWLQRVLIGVFSVMLTLLIYWLLGFVLNDIGQLRGPNWTDLEAARLDPSLRATEETIETSIAEVGRQLEDVRRRQHLLRESTASSQKTLSQLIELLRISIEQEATLPEEQQQALSESQQLFLENQRKDQEFNDSISTLEEERANLEDRLRVHRATMASARRPLQEEFTELQRAHDWRIAALKIGFLTPLLLVGGILFARYRSSRYAPMVYALDVALLAKTLSVMHQYFPAEYFKYVLILSALAIIGFLLARLLRVVALPGRDARLRQYREAYEAFLCPVCQFPIRRGPLKFMSWSPRSLRKTSLPLINAPDEPYTCPSCATPLYEKCASCGKVRHSRLPACEHCGVESDI